MLAKRHFALCKPHEAAALPFSGGGPAWVEARRQANRKVVFIRGKHIKYRTARGAGFPMRNSIPYGAVCRRLMWNTPSDGAEPLFTMGSRQIIFSMRRSSSQRRWRDVIFTHNKLLQARSLTSPDAWVLPYPCIPRFHSTLNLDTFPSSSEMGRTPPINLSRSNVPLCPHPYPNPSFPFF